MRPHERCFGRVLLFQPPLRPPLPPVLRAMETPATTSDPISPSYQALWNSMQRAQQKADDTEVRGVCMQLLEALALRARYLPGPTGVPGAPLRDGGADQTRAAEQPFEPPPWDGKAYRHEMRAGVMHVWEPADEADPSGEAEHAFAPPPTIETYTRDLTRLIHICGDAAVNSFCHRRLQASAGCRSSPSPVCPSPSPHRARPSALGRSSRPASSCT